MISPANDVYNFMEATGHIENRHPELYTWLVDEEFKELEDAQAANDEVETFDAILDLIWVLTGLAISMDLPLQAGWEEVARSNFAKVDPATGKVIKNSAGKVMKPIGWTPPDLATVINNYRNKNKPNEHHARPHPDPLPLFALAGYTA